MGGHIAEKLIIGSSKVSSGCGNDLQGATSLAYQAVRMFGMFGDSTAGYISSKAEESSEKRNADVDAEVKKILDVIIIISHYLSLLVSFFM
jgi:ATP-dependent Zn protease